MNISIVIPTFNSEKIIIELCNLIDNYINETYELIIVNDSSEDNTLSVLKKIKKNNSAVKIIHLEKNIGQVGSTLVGINHSVGEIVVTMDDDLQHHPKDIMNLVNYLRNSQNEIVVASWKQDETYVRNLSSLIFSIISSLLLFKSFKFRNTAFRALSKNINDEFFSFFLSRFWLDPRRLKVSVGQIEVLHQNQNFRPYSSFISRVKLSSKHLFIDTYLLQLLSILIFFKSPWVGVGVMFGLTILQKIVKKFVGIKRIRALKQVKIY